MESQDLEEALGNLVENAAKFARTSVVVRLRRTPDLEEDRAMYRVLK